MSTGATMQYQPVKSLAELSNVPVLKVPAPKKSYKIEVLLNDKEEQVIRKYTDGEVNFNGDESAENDYWEACDTIRDEMFLEVAKQLPVIEVPKALPPSSSIMLRMPDLASAPSIAPEERVISIGDKEGNPTGMSLSYRIAGDRAYLTRLGIPQEYAGRGFAKWLLRQAFLTVKAMGISQMTSDPKYSVLNKTAISPWRSLKNEGYPIVMSPNLCICDVQKLTSEQIKEDVCITTQEDHEL